MDKLDRLRDLYSETPYKESASIINRRGFLTLLSAGALGLNGCFNSFYLSVKSDPPGTFVDIRHNNQVAEQYSGIKTPFEAELRSALSDVYHVNVRAYLPGYFDEHITVRNDVGEVYFKLEKIPNPEDIEIPTVIDTEPSGAKLFSRHGEPWGTAPISNSFHYRKVWNPDRTVHYVNKIDNGECMVGQDLWFNVVAVMHGYKSDTSVVNFGPFNGYSEKEPRRRTIILTKDEKPFRLPVEIHPPGK